MNAEQEPPPINRLENVLNPAPAATAPPPTAALAAGQDIAAMVRSYATLKAHSERVQIEYQTLLNRAAESHHRLLESAASFTEPVAYFLQEQPGLVHVLTPPEAGQKQGRVATVALVII